jgi:hypothetical protein
MLSAVEELKHYSESQRVVLDEFIRHYAPPFGEIKSWISMQNLISPSSQKSMKQYIRRLSAIADYEGKTRIIAIGDY